MPRGPCQCPHPCGEPLAIHTSAGGPPTLAGHFVSVSCGVPAPLLSVFMCTKFCVCPSRLESLFPSVFWKAYNQSHSCSKPDSLGIPSPFLRSPGWKAWHAVQNFHNSERTSLVLLFSSLRVNHLEGVGFDLIMIVPLLPSCWSFFVFGCEVSFFVGSSVLLSIVVQQLVATVVFSQEMSAHPSTLPSWTGSPVHIL